MLDLGLSLLCLVHPDQRADGQEESHLQEGEPERKNITFFEIALDFAVPVLENRVEKQGSNVDGRSDQRVADRALQLIINQLLRNAEVRDLDLVVLQQQVVRLYVSVVDLLQLDKIKAVQAIPHHRKQLCIREERLLGRPLFDLVVQRRVAQLHDDHQIVARLHQRFLPLKNLLDLYHVRVLVDDLVAHQLAMRLLKLIEIRALDDLDGPFLVVDRALSAVDVPESPPP